MPPRKAIGLERAGPSWRALARALRLPRTLGVTRAGRTFLVITVGIGLGAINTGNNLLYLVLALLLGLIVASGILSERCLRDLQVRRVGADAAFAGEPFAFRWAVSKAKGAAFALRLSEENPDVQGEGAVAHVPAGREVIVRGDLVCLRRGPHHLAGVRVTTEFPLGLFAKTRFYPLEDALLVYPRRVPSPARAEGAHRAPDGAARAAERGGGGGEVVGLSPLREGDDARRIHWVKSAALGEWVRLDREKEERRTYLLRATARAPEEQVERACEQVAAQARRLLSQGHEVGLDADERRLRPASGPAQERRILSALARLGFEGGRAR